MPYVLEHRTTKTVAQGMNFPLGANLTPDGVNFALYSRNATEIFLLLFDKPEGEPTDIIQLTNRDKFIWHALVKGLKAGQLYSYKVRGEYRPEWGPDFKFSVFYNNLDTDEWFRANNPMLNDTDLAIDK